MKQLSALDIQKLERKGAKISPAKVDSVVDTVGPHIMKVADGQKALAGEMAKVQVATTLAIAETGDLTRKGIEDFGNTLKTALISREVKGLKMVRDDKGLLDKVLFIR
tara:strand:+ start:47 stop:370 length:324 start_codon:yes stop_codon:yes gene_type:complete